MGNQSKLRLGEKDVYNLLKHTVCNCTAEEEKGFNEKARMNLQEKKATKLEYIWESSVIDF